MATDMVSAAVPGPTDPTESDPARGLLASIVAPVGPARRTSDSASEGAIDVPAAGMSSADYHGGDTTQQAAGQTVTARTEKSVWRAWLLAGAARWGKGGGTANKRLDLKKAEAQAQQVKETRQVTVNRSAGLPGKSGASGAGGKSLNSKTSTDRAAKTPKNSSSGNGSAGSGGGSSSGRGSTGSAGKSGGAGDKSTGSTKGSTGNGGTGAPKTPKTDGSKGGTGSTPQGAAGGGKNGTQGPAGSGGKTGSSGKDGGAGNASGISSSKGKKDGGEPGKTTAAKDGARGKDGKQPAGSTGSPDGAKPKSDTETSGTPGKKNAAKPGDGAKTDPTNKPAPADKATSPKDQAGQPEGNAFTTRESRETGYRDGTRAARTAAHVKAYRDGVKDGWADTTEAAEREKTRLDKAHAERKQARKDQPVNETTTSAGHREPQPIGVKEVTASHVILGDGAAKPSMTRGEVRSLKGFERRLRDKADTMTKAAEGTKALKAHADAQATQATKLLEQAKAVKGGENTVAALTKLADAAKAQAAGADEIHKRAVRAADACTTVLVNAETRYGGIYKAVLDSPLTTPAELTFYKESAHA